MNNEEKIKELVWKDIPEYEGYYEVNIKGEVRSLDRIVKRKGGDLKLKGRILKQGLSSNGYYTVSLTKNSKGRTYCIHILIATLFMGFKPCGMNLVINHIDHDKTNNSIDNLELVTQRENANQKHLESSSKYTGVTWDKKSKRWLSRIVYKNKKLHLGSFENEYDAHLSYENKLKEISNG